MNDVRGLVCEREKVRLVRRDDVARCKGTGADGVGHPPCLLAADELDRVEIELPERCGDLVEKVAARRSRRSRRVRRAPAGRLGGFGPGSLLLVGALVE